MVDQITVYWMLGVLGIMIAFGVFSLIGYRYAKKRGDGTLEDEDYSEILPEHQKLPKGAPVQNKQE